MEENVCITEIINNGSYRSAQTHDAVVTVQFMLHHGSPGTRNNPENLTIFVQTMHLF